MSALSSKRRGELDRVAATCDDADAHPRVAGAYVGVPDAPTSSRAPVRDRDAALPAHARRPRPRAGPHDDPARHLHDEAQRGRRDGADQLARAGEYPSVRARGSGRGLSRARSASSRPGSPRSPATTQCRCSPTRARRASSPGCSRSARYHRARDQEQRAVCLIPQSRTAPTPRRAAMAGMTVIVVDADERRQRRPRRPRSARSTTPAIASAALMVTYPSTHGVFEERHPRRVRVRARARRPGVSRRREPERARRLGAARRRSAPTCRTSTCTRRSASRTAVAARASGPIGVRAHLAPLLAGPSARSRRRAGAGRRDLGGAVGLGGDPADLVGVHRDDGRDGLTRATEVAILNANYIARPARTALSRCSTRGAQRPASRTSASSTCGRSRTTRASRSTTSPSGSIDYGFHAPTMSFPVAGTLMIEPTESEALPELDRFCDAMIAIRAEIDARSGRAVAGRRQPARARAAHRGRRSRATSGHTPTRASGRVSRRALRAGSTGRPSRASTAPTATATSSAAASDVADAASRCVLGPKNVAREHFSSREHLRTSEITRRG